MSIIAFLIVVRCNNKTDMCTTARMSYTAVLSFVFGIGAVVCGIMALSSSSDAYLAGIASCLVLCVALGIYSWVRISS
jgi:hypothetical protein